MLKNHNFIFLHDIGGIGKSELARHYAQLYSANYDADYFKRKINILQKISTPRHLIIIDNFDTEECENIGELLSLNCKIIFTSRIDFEDIFSQYEVNIIDNFDSLSSIYSHYSQNNYCS